MPPGSLIILVFDGLDTLATVTLDGKTILESNNMFLAHRVDITKALEADGGHVLEITFDCAMLRARELYEQDKKHKWASFNGDPARMSLRKAQYHWGWDWGPILMTAGIWRNVRMEVYSARIEDLWTDMHLADDYRRATITAFADVSSSAPGSGSFKARFVLRLHGKEVGSAEDVLTNNTAKATFDIDNPSLWWPNGYGEPTLYELSVSYRMVMMNSIKPRKRSGYARQKSYNAQINMASPSFFASTASISSAVVLAGYRRTVCFRISAQNGIGSGWN